MSEYTFDEKTCLRDSIRAFVVMERTVASKPVWLRDQLMTDVADAVRRDAAILVETPLVLDEPDVQRLLRGAESLVESYLDAL